MKAPQVDLWLQEGQQARPRDCAPMVSTSLQPSFDIGVTRLWGRSPSDRTLAACFHPVT